MKAEIDDSIIDFANAKNLPVETVAPFIIKIREIKSMITDLEIEYQDFRSRFVLTDVGDPTKDLLRTQLVISHNNIQKWRNELNNVINKFEYIICPEECEYCFEDDVD